MQNKIVITLVAIALVAVFSFTIRKKDLKNQDEKGIEFHKGTWKEALQQAKNENKLIFLDIYATWCGPCKKIKANTFSNYEVGNLFNQKFINVALNGEKGEGKILMQQYALRSFPSLLFIDGNGKIVWQTAGYHNPNQLLELGRKISKK